MENWQDAGSQQVKLLTARLNDVLSEGLAWLRSELGVDVGLKPELIPPWMVLLAAGAGLLLLVALWASVCRAVFKKRPAVSHVDDGLEVKRDVSKPVKPEEPKKKKKKSEKKAQPNGRAVLEPQEEAVVSEELLPHQQPEADLKTGKVPETKKAKKKAKQAGKETKTVTTDGKEPEEGTWETKVSNKEKREQRKKDKGSSDGSASPGGGNAPVSAAPEQPKAPAATPPPASQKKKKVNNREVVEMTAAGTTEMAVKVPAFNVAPNSDSWTPPTQAAPLWRAGIDDSWTVIDRQMPSNELKLVSVAGLGIGPAKPQPVSELSWLCQPRVDDEWSGLNGGLADPSSDWNAPSEAWGNYEEPTPKTVSAQEQPFPEPVKVTQLVAAEDDEDVKDRGDATTDGEVKAKKKKKKKKKAEDGGPVDQVEESVKETAPVASAKKQPPVLENAASVQPVRAAAAEKSKLEQTRGERPVKDVITQKPPVTQVPQKPTEGEPTAKQNNLPAPPQRKNPEDSQAPKPAKKKKARRET